jgi:hypothetical protein
MGGMSRNIDIEISKDIPAERHEALLQGASTLLEKVRPEYVAWLKFNGNPIVIENQELGMLGAMIENSLGNLIVTLSPLLFTMPITPQTFVIEEEIVHMIDQHTGFSQSPKFRQAAELDMEDLNTKALLAVSRIWHGFIKSMTTGDYYSARAPDALYQETLPDILAAHRFLIEADSENVETRKGEMLKRFTESLRAALGEEAANKRLREYSQRKYGILGVIINEALNHYQLEAGRLKSRLEAA